MGTTSKKYLRMCLHLPEDVAVQVRAKASEWGLKDSKAVRQIIMLGLRTAQLGESADAEVTRNLSSVQATLVELLYVQVQSLLYSRDLATEVTVLATASTPEARDKAKKIRDDLDKRVAADAKHAAGKIVDGITKRAAANRAKRTNGDNGDNGGATAKQ